jgi:hypothetical protein
MTLRFLLINVWTIKSKPKEESEGDQGRKKYKAVKQNSITPTILYMRPLAPPGSPAKDGVFRCPVPFAYPPLLPNTIFSARSYESPDGVRDDNLRRNFGSIEGSSRGAE